MGSSAVVYHKLAKITTAASKGPCSLEHTTRPLKISEGIHMDLATALWHFFSGSWGGSKVRGALWMWTARVLAHVLP